MLKLNLILFSAILVLCESAAIIDKINIKCKIEDHECHKNLYNSVLQEIAANGIQELGIPKVDPYEVKHMEVTPLGMIKISIHDGYVKGFKSCVKTSYIKNLEIQRSDVVIECDQVIIGGNFKVQSLPALATLLGGIDIHGEGTGSLTIDKIQINLNLPFEVVKLDDGENYFRLISDEATYTFDVLDKVTFDVNNVFIGKTDISAVTISIFNEYWKFISKSLGRNFIDKAMEFVYENINKFFTAVPAKDLLIGDVSSYVKS